mgnify:CR=1 FL=1
MVKILLVNSVFLITLNNPCIYLMSYIIFKSQKNLSAPLDQINFQSGPIVIWNLFGFPIYVGIS